MKIDWLLSLKYLFSKRKDSFLSFITFASIGGVLTGVMALIVVLSVMGGFQSQIKEKILGTNSDIVLLKFGGGITSYGSLITKVTSEKEVTGVSPFILSQVLLSSDSGVTGSILRGVDEKTVVKTTKIGKYVEDGSLKNLDKIKKVKLEEGGYIKVPGIMLGKELAKNLGVSRGDLVTVISPTGSISPTGVSPKMRQFQVRGIFVSGMYDFDAGVAIMGLSSAQKFFDMGKSVSGLEISVTDVENAPDIAKRIEKKIGFPYYTRDWAEMNYNLFSALKLEKTIMFIILILIIFVAAFNIASTLVMMVMDKRKEIAILKTMGATPTTIRRVFILMGFIIGTSGVILGDILGFILCEIIAKYQFIKLPSEIYYITTIPVQIDLTTVVIIDVLAILISVLAAFYPASKAVKIKPAEILRYQ